MCVYVCACVESSSIIFCHSYTCERAWLYACLWVSMCERSCLRACVSVCDCASMRVSRLLSFLERVLNNTRCIYIHCTSFTNASTFAWHTCVLARAIFLTRFLAWSSQTANKMTRRKSFRFVQQTGFTVTCVPWLFVDFCWLTIVRGTWPPWIRRLFATKHLEWTCAPAMCARDGWAGAESWSWKRIRDSLGSWIAWKPESRNLRLQPKKDFTLFRQHGEGWCCVYALYILKRTWFNPGVSVGSVWERYKRLESKCWGYKNKKYAIY